MPWQETDAMQERLEFVVQARQERTSLSALCRAYGISRKTGYKWLRRYQAAGTLAGVHEHSRRPHTTPARTPPALEARVVALRRQYGWGARKLRVLLAQEGVRLSVATVHRILLRHDLVRPADRHRPAPRRFERAAPNALWQMDFKGDYALAGGGRCYPLSLLDDHSRYVVGLYPLAGPRLEPTWRALVRTFQTHGVPDAMLMDHGTPWWSNTQAHGLTRLAVRLIGQGIGLHYSGLGHPQTQGKVERWHRTLKHTLAHHGVPDTLAAFGPALERARTEYNTVRPHEALELAVPATRYTPSPRAYQPHPPAWAYPAGVAVARLNSQGMLPSGHRRYFVSEALADEHVGVQPFDGKLLVTYRHMCVREIDLAAGRTTAVVRPAANPEVPPMS